MKKLFLLFCCALLGSTAYAQNSDIRVLFESEPGLRLGVLLDSATVSLRHRADLNLDGTPDLTLLSLDEQDNPIEIFTIHAASLDTLWRFQYQDIATAMGTTNFRFKGFFSFDASTTRHAIFRSPNALGIIAILIGKNSGMIPLVLPADRFAVLDLTGDGATEIIIENPETGTVQVYGDPATNTATEAEIETTLARLFQNYPNPFRETTTIAYTVVQPGPVNITVYDLLGRTVATLVDAPQPIGQHQVSWDGRNAHGQPLAAGTYFYRLQVGETISSKQTIRIR